MPVTSGEKLRRIVGQALAGRLVPLAGAGLSLGAVSDHGEAWRHHDTQTMKETLCSQVYPPGGGSSNTAGGAPPCDHLGELCERFLHLAPQRPPQPPPDPPGGCAPNTGRYPRYERLVRVLQIRKFTSLGSTPAHRFIAYLAREGALSEVVTTNYDTCFERAWRASWGQDEAAGRDLQGRRLPPAQTPGLHVAWSLETYRQNAAQPGLTTRPGGRPVHFKVYKINGCAEALCRGPRKGGLDARDILLTPRQLQRWRERAWARDLFRDRLRTRSLLVTGFGSDEPQIHHTISMVEEEWSGSRDEPGGSGTASATSLLGEPNPLFVVGYSKGDPTFHQEQALWAYQEAHHHGPGSGDSEERPHLDLYVGPGDHEGFAYVGELLPHDAPTGEASRLPGDLFWHEIYARVAWERLRPHLDTRTSPLVLQLSEVRTIPRLLAELQSLLGRPDEPDEPDAKLTVAGRALWVWGTWGDAGGREADGGAEGRRPEPALPPAISALSAVLWPGARPRYASILEHGDLLARLLLVWAALRRDAERRASSRDCAQFILRDLRAWADPANHTKHGLRVALGVGGPRCLITARAQAPRCGDSGSAGREAGAWSLPPGIQSQLVLLHSDLHGRARRAARRGLQGARTQRIFLEDVLREADKPIDSLARLGAVLRHHLFLPTTAARRGQPTLRRASLREIP